MSFDGCTPRCSPLSSPWRRLGEEEEGTSYLERWRQATLVINAIQRFKCNSEQCVQMTSQSSPNSPSRKFRLGTNVIRAIFRFKEAGKLAGIDRKELVTLVADHNLELLEQLGGVDGLAKALSTSTKNGIEDEVPKIERRRLLYGSNTYPQQSPKGFLAFLWEACQDLTLVILGVCAVVSLALALATKASWYDGASIAFTVILVVCVTACSDYKQSLQFQRLNAEKRKIHVEVLRGGRRIGVSIFELVVGDVVPLKTGDQIPADGVLVEGYSLVVDESSLTGESDPMSKGLDHPFFMSGCKVVDGYGTILITSVGINTEWGRAMAALTDDISDEETPLQMRLAGAATVIGAIGLAVAIICFSMLFIRYFVEDYKKDKKAVAVFKRNVNILSVAVTILVVAVPEGLPLAVTLSLAYSMRKLMTHKSLVRHLAACETMGSATTICSDKTGTLTMNQMTVIESWVAGQTRSFHEIRGLPDAVTSVIFDGVAHNSAGSVYYTLDRNGVPEVAGSPTEKALLSWGLQLGMDYSTVRAASSIIAVEPFNSTKKMAGVAIKRNNGTLCALWKGAAEIILDLCENWLDGEGTEKVLSSEMVSSIHGTLTHMAASTLRCLAFAIKTYNSMDGRPIPTAGLTFVALVGIKDPCRPGVREAVRKCQDAGVKVRMVTGDNVLTARAIASECGILMPGGLVCEGSFFRNLTDNERFQIVPKIDVLARSTPSDKLLLVKTLKSLNEIVAVTGDGTNDAPALREAHIGLSMGIIGTEVAKESSDIIILDDNFASVVKVVHWGRSVYENIQKFIQFQLTVNLAALSTNLVAAGRSENVPLNTVQLLWVNLIMDTLGALALATEPPTEEMMERAPIGLSEPLVTNVMWRNIFGQAAYQVAVLLVLYFRGDQILHLKGSPAQKIVLRNTIIFNSFVLCQVFNEINARKLQKLNVLKGVFQSYLFCTVIGVTSVIQIVIIEFLGKYFKTTRLVIHYWLLCVGIGFLSIPLACLMKLVHVPKKPIFNANWSRRRRRPQHPGTDTNGTCWEWKKWNKNQSRGFEHAVQVEQ
ncbi:calcium-transporting ATPase 5, plasma membrane-type [Selaginella moellendorffii]|uniref:calcium-transporting ATPase 5, plasma membrane-type n=1 Tax=Selaginella moellendorffii TaxID=88036 RepID=UPI000D1C8F4B|nr:calcium-transporting ATPase 5, plasma membrane-type [Selaginella moellendorffii]|eukprot:XP_024520094.1 calcium-transporting ATPase 5, plasma membrane-type [Selaginella moellendorffii]